MSTLETFFGATFFNTILIAFLLIFIGGAI